MAQTINLGEIRLVVKNAGLKEDGKDPENEASRDSPIRQQQLHNAVCIPVVIAVIWFVFRFRNVLTVVGRDCLIVWS